MNTKEHNTNLVSVDVGTDTISIWQHFPAKNFSVYSEDASFDGVSWLEAKEYFNTLCTLALNNIKVAI